MGDVVAEADATWKKVAGVRRAEPRFDHEGLEVSLGGLAEDPLVEREIRHSLAQTLGLKLKILHRPDMIRL